MVVCVDILPPREDNDRRDDLQCPEFVMYSEVSRKSLPATLGHLQSNVKSVALSVAGFLSSLFAEEGSVAICVTCAIVIFGLAAFLSILAYTGLHD